MEEPFRWIVDLTVMRAFESGALDVPHFYFTGDDYRYRFDVDAKRRFIDLLREQFNSGVKYKQRMLKWDTVIEEKATEVVRFLDARAQQITFTEPTPVLVRYDGLELRNRVLALTSSGAKKIGISRSEHRYLRRKASAESPFKIYARTRQRLIKV